MNSLFLLFGTAAISASISTTPVQPVQSFNCLKDEVTVEAFKKDIVDVDLQKNLVNFDIKNEDFQKNLVNFDIENEDFQKNLVNFDIENEDFQKNLVNFNIENEDFQKNLVNFDIESDELQYGCWPKSWKTQVKGFFDKLKGVVKK